MRACVCLTEGLARPPVGGPGHREPEGSSVSTTGSRGYSPSRPPPYLTRTASPHPSRGPGTVTPFGTAGARSRRVRSG
ncbi:hypothetical protein GCM10009654_00200 [Streptomyces hebeiensis]|uniref:Uncharacterized protein n=1 Tax=Streptomyces hebeiensis TaxID=229486 RepID=A0ABN1UHF4_9ACTN